MRLATWRSGEGNRQEATSWGALIGDKVVRLGDAGSPGSPDSLLAYVQQGVARRSWSEASLGADDGKATPLVQVRLLAPIPQPAKNLFGTRRKTVVAAHD